MCAGLTQHGEGGIGGDGARCVFRSAAVQAHVLWFDIHDEEHVVVGHDVHSPLPGSGEICAAVFLPGDLRRRVALSGTLQSCGVARPDGAVSGGLYEGRENWETERGTGELSGPFIQGMSNVKTQWASPKLFTPAG